MTAGIFVLAARAQRRTVRGASFAGIFAVIAGIGLVATSGWFLTGAALAGAGGVMAVQAFNYLLPSASIRGLAIARTLSRYFERLLGHKAALLSFADVRPRLFARLAAAEVGAFAGQGGGKVAAHLGSDVEALEDLVIRRVAMTGAATGALAGLGAALLAGAVPAIIFATGLALTLLATWFLAPRVLSQAHHDHGTALQSLKALYAEYAACGVEVALYGQARHISAILAAKAQELDRARLAIVRHEGLFQGLQLIVGSATIAAMLATTRAALPLQALAALAAAGAFEAMSGLTQSFLQRARVNTAMERLAEIAQLPPRAVSESKLQVDHGGSGPALTLSAEECTITIEPAGRVRLAGPSGCGKTRLLENLVGLRDDAPQSWRIDGIEAGSLGLEVLRDIFAISTQDAPLIAGTLAENLSLAQPGISEAAMWSALEVACLADTVRAMPDSLDTWLGTDGARLSGGQRKRLSLARALLAQKPWLVLDEPTEGLDAQTEQRLAHNLDAWLRDTGTGLVLVNHRPGLDWLADQALSL